MSSNRNSVHWNWCHRGMNSRANRWFLESELESSRRCVCNLVPEDMAFVRLSWLLDRGNSLRDLPPLQGMPSAALVFPGEMSQAYFVTHRWLEADHPDRSGQQLALALSANWVQHPDPESVADWARVPRVHKTGVWYDYMCMPQAPLGEEEEKERNHLLQHVLLLPRVSTVIAVASGMKLFTHRAWCVAEAAVAQTVDNKWELVSLSRQTSRYERFFNGDRSSVSRHRSREGYMAGLLKLEQWLRESRVSRTPESEEFADEARTHAEFAKQVLQLNTELAFPAGHRSLTRAHLLSIAGQLGLETTVPDDLLFCMKGLHRFHVEQRA